MCSDKFRGFMNLMFSLDEKEIWRWSHNLEIDKVIRRILKSKCASNDLAKRKDFSTTCYSIQTLTLKARKLSFSPSHRFAGLGLATYTAIDAAQRTIPRTYKASQSDMIICNSIALVVLWLVSRLISVPKNITLRYQRALWRLISRYNLISTFFRKKAELAHTVLKNVGEGHGSTT